MSAVRGRADACKEQIVTLLWRRAKTLETGNHVLQRCAVTLLPGGHCGHVSFSRTFFSVKTSIFGFYGVCTRRFALTLAAGNLYQKTVWRTQVWVGSGLRRITVATGARSRSHRLLVRVVSLSFVVL